jgi:hypothetical protein
MKKAVVIMFLAILTAYVHGQSGYFGVGWGAIWNTSYESSIDRNNDNLNYFGMGTGPTLGFGAHNFGLNINGKIGVTLYGGGFKDGDIYNSSEKKFLDFLHWYTGLYGQFYYYNAFSIGVGVGLRNLNIPFIHMNVSIFDSLLFPNYINPSSDYDGTVGLYCDYFPSENSVSIGVMLTLTTNYANVSAFNDYRWDNEFRATTRSHGKAGRVITNYYGKDRNLTIPGKIYGSAVLTIGEKAFNNKNLESVYIPNSVEIIRENAFTNNPLTSVTLAGSPEISDSAFPNNFIEALKIHAANANSASIVGTYTYQDDQWYFGGEVIVGDYVTLNRGSGINIEYIDGKRPETYYYDDGILVSPGLHTVVVSYRASVEVGDKIITTTSKGSVTFEHRYFFEGGKYIFTGTVEGDQIIFKIESR